MNIHARLTSYKQPLLLNFKNSDFFLVEKHIACHTKELFNSTVGINSIVNNLVAYFIYISILSSRPRKLKNLINNDSFLMEKVHIIQRELEVARLFHEIAPADINTIVGTLLVALKRISLNEGSQTEIYLFMHADQIPTIQKNSELVKTLKQIDNETIKKQIKAIAEKI